MGLSSTLSLFNFTDIPKIGTGGNTKSWISMNYLDFLSLKVIITRNDQLDVISLPLSLPFSFPVF